MSFFSQQKCCQHASCSHSPLWTELLCFNYIPRTQDNLPSRRQEVLYDGNPWSRCILGYVVHLGENKHSSHEALLQCIQIKIVGVGVGFRFGGEGGLFCFDLGYFLRNPSIPAGMTDKMLSRKQTHFTKYCLTGKKTIFQQKNNRFWPILILYYYTMWLNVS